MKHQQPDAAKRQLSSVLLTALILGLLFTPVGYIVIGALRQFPGWFQLSSLPLVVLGIGVLCFRYLGKWYWPEKRLLQILIDMVCWGLVITFLYFISLFTLMTQSERLGFFIFVYFICSVIALCSLFMIRTPLEVKLEYLPVTLKAPIVLAVAAGLMIGSIWFLVAPSRFI